MKNKVVTLTQLSLSKSQPDLDDFEGDKYMFLIFNTKKPSSWKSWDILDKSMYSSDYDRILGRF